MPCTGTAPTWSSIYTMYLASDCVGCHGQMDNAPDSYDWLQSLGQIDGASSTIIHSGSCLKLFGGNMPTSGVISSAAKCALTLWVQGGAENN